MTLDVDKMVNNFLGWKLPKDFYPDAGISFSPSTNQNSGIHSWPTGTNLFDAVQSKEMIEFMLKDAPQQIDLDAYRNSVIGECVQACVSQYIDGDNRIAYDCTTAILKLKKVDEMNYPQDLNDLTSKQADWLKSMGWWKNKTPLESLMLVVSECGEAANEVRGEVPTDNFKTELADIILRVLGIAAEHDINIQQAVLDKMSKNLKLAPNPDRIK